MPFILSYGSKAIGCCGYTSCVAQMPGCLDFERGYVCFEEGDVGRALTKDVCGYLRENG